MSIGFSGNNIDSSSNLRLLGQDEEGSSFGSLRLQGRHGVEILYCASLPLEHGHENRLPLNQNIHQAEKNKTTINQLSSTHEVAGSIKLPRRQAAATVIPAFST